MREELLPEPDGGAANLYQREKSWYLSLTNERRAVIPEPDGGAAHLYCLEPAGLAGHPLLGLNLITC